MLGCDQATSCPVKLRKETLIAKVYGKSKVFVGEHEPKLWGRSSYFLARYWKLCKASIACIQVGKVQSMDLSAGYIGLWVEDHFPYRRCASPV